MMSRTIGQRLGMLAHIRQSVADILITQIGSRVMRRTYGSLLSALLDQPDNQLTQTRVFAAVASALMRWEPRIEIEKMSVARYAERPGFVELQITASYTGTFSRDAAPFSLSVSIGKGGEL